MGAWIWVLIPLVMFIGGFIIEYQKNEMEMMGKNRQNEVVVVELRKLVNAMRSRIENLATIAASHPDEFPVDVGKGMSEIEIEEKNRQQVSDIADKQRSQ
jgi:hypothetical protein